jgi:hypothetical protein
MAATSDKNVVKILSEVYQHWDIVYYKDTE